MTTNLPPALGVALDEIAQTIGPEHVLISGESFEQRARDTTPSVQRPAGFVFPDSVEAVQAIVRIANRHAIALWPVSKGKNWGYGAATPVYAGALIMVLERMNRILEVNEELAYTVIEPGVTYGQLNRYLREKHPSLWTDTTDSTPEGSVIGNALERGLGETPYGDHFGNLCGLEVVLPTGERVCTGGGPEEGARTWNTHKWGTGPYLEGLFSQSNLGIVTKAGLWLMPAPPAFVSVIFEVRHEDRVAGAIDAIRRLTLRGIIRSQIHGGNDSVILSILNSQDRQYPAKAAPLTEEKRAAQRQHFNVGLWTLNWGLYGTAREISVWKSILRRELSPYGQLLFVSDGMIRMSKRLVPWLAQRRASIVGRVGAALFRMVVGKPVEFAELGPHQHGLLKGIPTDYFLRYAYCQASRPAPDRDLDPARDGCGEMWHAPVIPLTSADLQRILGVGEPLFKKHGKDFCVTLLLMNPRSIITLFGIFFAREDPAERKQAEALYNDLFQATRDAGYQPYRTSVASMPVILDVNPAFKALAGRLKGALDPQGILSPGRYGVDKGG